MEQEKRKFTDIVKDNMQKIVIFVVSIIYISQGLFAIQKKENTIANILGSMALSVIIGMIISNSLNQMGLKDGRKSKLFVSSLGAYGEAKGKATPYFDKLQDFCEYKNSYELNAKKKDIIQNAGLNWKKYKLDYYEEYPPTDKKQLWALQRAKHCTLDRLTPQALLSDIPKNKRIKSRFGESERDFSKRNYLNDIISKVGMGVVCGLYGLVPLITQENIQEQLANVLWNTIQISMWLIFGIMKYMDARAFMENEYRQTHIIQKTEYLNEFVITCQNNPDSFKEFNEDEEIEEWLRKKVKKDEQEDVSITTNVI